MMRIGEEGVKLIGVISLAILTAFSFITITPPVLADEVAVSDNMASAEKKVVNKVEKKIEPIAASPITKPAHPASQSAGASEGTMDKVKDFLRSIPNPFSEVSSKDVGCKPRIRPHLHGGSSFTSNPTASKSQQGAWQARVSPGITVEVPVTNKLYTMADYTYSFATTQGCRFSNNNNTHNLDALARYDFNDATAFGVRNNIQWSQMPDQAGKMFFLETVKPEVTHRFGKKLLGSMNYQFQHFRDVTNRDNQRDPITNEDVYTTRDTFNDNQVGASLYYDVSKKLQVGPSVTWNVRDFAKVPKKDYWQINPLLNANYGIGTKMKLGGNFGWAYRGFDHGGYDSSLVWAANFTHLVGKKFTWGLSYAKTLQDTFDTSFIYRDDSIATLLDNYDRRFRVVDVQRLGVNATYNLNEKNMVNSWFAVQFTDTRVSDDVISNDRNNEKAMSLGLAYMYRLTRYLNLTLGYALDRSFQSHDTPYRNQYTVHKVLCGANLNF